MEGGYTVGQLAALAGVSVRTLHHFEEQGLLAPSRSASGYRVYSPADVDRLQQVLLYRELGMQLSDIRTVLNDPDFDPADALRTHLADLKSHQQRTQRLIESVERTLDALKGGSPMSDEEKFEAFKEGLIEENERTYGDEVRKRWGDKAADAANERVRNMSKGDYEGATALEATVKAEVLAGLADGDPDGVHAKAAAQAHALWLKHFWSEGMYSPESHAALARGYLADTRFKKYYEAWAPGATEFLVAAIEKMANEA